ncbi:MAG TPA: hypothetical protein PKE45_10185 [Caldilineaceae bacterium]|nr:hypothetical protein [Caldilineaceae bacterium]
MAEEKANSGSRGNQGGRRRYFRRRPQNERGGQNQSGPPSKEPPARAAAQEKGAAPARHGRLGRRRRRSSSRLNDSAKQNAAAESILELDDYVPPDQVFVYTHVSRPGSRDSYEFRSEHFSKVGRRLEDYQIDLSSLITESGEIRLTSIAPVTPPAEVEEIETDVENDL